MPRRERLGAPGSGTPHACYEGYSRAGPSSPWPTRGPKSGSCPSGSRKPSADERSCYNGSTTGPPSRMEPGLRRRRRGPRGPRPLGRAGRGLPPGGDELSGNPPPQRAKGHTGVGGAHLTAASPTALRALGFRGVPAPVCPGRHVITSNLVLAMAFLVETGHFKTGASTGQQERQSSCSGGADRT